MPDTRLTSATFPGPLAWSRHLPDHPSLHQIDALLSILSGHPADELAASENLQSRGHVDNRRMANCSGSRPSVRMYSCASLLGQNHPRKLPVDHSDTDDEQCGQHHHRLHHPATSDPYCMEPLVASQPKDCTDGYIWAGFLVSDFLNSIVSVLLRALYLLPVFSTCIVSILRVTTTPVIESDFAWETVSVIAWTTAEVLTGTIIANISTLRPLVGRYVRAWATRATKESSYQLDYLPSHSQKTPGTSAADRRSGLICPPRRLTGGGWLDLSESDDQVPGVRTLEPVCLDEGRGHSRGSIRVTKEWSVDA